VNDYDATLMASYMEFIMQKKFVKIDVFDTPNLLLTGQTVFPYAHISDLVI
jgi:hypothetical protein